MLLLAQLELVSLGSVEISALPAPSVATHSEAETQEIPLSAVSPSMFVVAQVGAGSVGSVEISTFPSPSTAAQNDVDGQDV
jgi:hypothetical protein